MQYETFTQLYLRKQGLELLGELCPYFLVLCCESCIIACSTPHPRKEALEVSTLCLKIIVAHYYLRSRVSTKSEPAFPTCVERTRQSSVIKEDFAYKPMALR